MFLKRFFNLPSFNTTEENTGGGDPPKEEASPSLNDIIKDAMEKNLPKEEKEEKEEEKAPVKKVEAKKEDPKEEEEDEDKLTDEELIHAKNLFKALKDEKRGKDVLAVMAREAGLLPGASKSEQKDAVKTIESVLHAALGESFPELAKILSPAIKEAVELAAEEKTKEIKEWKAQQEKAQADRLMDEAYESATSKYENYDDKVGAQILKLMDEMPARRGTDPKKYFERITSMAFQELNLAPILKGEKKSVSTEDIKKRIDSNRNDAQSRLASKGEVTKGKEVSSSNDKMSIDEAIRAGMAKADELFASKK